MSLVDGGAWRGDTLTAWQQSFGSFIGKIYAFEPDANVLPFLHTVVAELSLEDKTEVIEAGLYSHSGTLNVKETDDMVEIDSDGDIGIGVVKMDDVIKEVMGKLYIKMDLEGSEVEALEGARETIRKHRPIMAICVYHHMEDVLMVPRKVREIADGYKFYLRSGFHTECYCLPEESVVTESW